MGPVRTLDLIKLNGILILLICILGYACFASAQNPSSNDLELDSHKNQALSDGSTQTPTIVQQGELGFVAKKAAALFDSRINGRKLNFRNCDYISSSHKGPRRLGLSFGQCLFFNITDKLGTQHADTNTIFPGVMRFDMYIQNELIGKATFKWRPSAGAFNLFYRSMLFIYDKARIFNFGKANKSVFVENYEMSVSEIKSTEVFKSLKIMGILPETISINEKITNSSDGLFWNEVNEFKAVGQLSSYQSANKNATEFDLSLKMNMNNKVECESRTISDYNPFTTQKRFLKEKVACAATGQDESIQESLKSQIQWENDHEKIP